ncbi:oxysterol binding family protein [Pelomyxa schiedti]|nr:oxysterol binding family protein [Pelomyxa schiedti]
MDPDDTAWSDPTSTTSSASAVITPTLAFSEVPPSMETSTVIPAATCLTSSSSSSVHKNEGPRLLNYSAFNSLAKSSASAVAGAAGWCCSIAQRAYGGGKGLLGLDTLKVNKRNEGDDKEEWNKEQQTSLWQRLSSLIGKDIVSLISLPIWVFEPTSFLQTMAEPLQYSALLDKAVECECVHEKLAYITAWVTAMYSLAVRTRKPFNPLLGETFEVIAKDGSYRFLAEQVSHHPPISVAKVWAEKWWLVLELHVCTKFYGNSLEVTIEGTNHFQDLQSGTHFTWGHLSTTAHNLLLGSVWVDHWGDLTVRSSTGDYANVRFEKTGWMSAGRYQVSGGIFDASNVKEMELSGKWNESLWAHRVHRNDSGRDCVHDTLLWAFVPEPVHPKFKINKFVQQNLLAITAEQRAVLPPLTAVSGQIAYSWS